jgi:hypothetical protein
MQTFEGSSAGPRAPAVRLSEGHAADRAGGADRRACSAAGARGEPCGGSSQSPATPQRSPRPRGSHRPGTLTLVMMSTVKAAQAVY